MGLLDPRTLEFSFVLAPAELAAGDPLQEVSYQLAIGNDNGLVLQPAEADELAHGCVWRRLLYVLPEDAKPSNLTAG